MAGVDSAPREEKIALVQRLLAAAQRRDLDAVTGIYADDAVAVSPIFGELRGAAAIAASWDTLFAAYSDLAFSITTVLVDGDRVAVLGAVATTDRFGLFGRPPTGGPLAYRLVLLFTIAGGRITRDERIYDSTGVAERLEKVRIDKELRLAADVQRALLHRPAHLAAYCDSAADSIPCRAIGGDFFEVTPLASGATAIVLGDVSGKGPAAALLAAMIQGMIAVEAQTSDGPAAIVSRLNERLAARDFEARFATIVYGVLWPDGRFVYTNAGHNPPLVIGAGGIRQLDAGGSIVGAFGGSVFVEEMVQLRPGDTIVMYSDGVTEACSPDGEEFGDERLSRWLAGSPASTASTLVGGLLGTLRAFCGDADQRDDITMVVTRLRS